MEMSFLYPKQANVNQAVLPCQQHPYPEQAVTNALAIMKTQVDHIPKLMARYALITHCFPRVSHWQGELREIERISTNRASRPPHGSQSIPHLEAGRNATKGERAGFRAISASTFWTKHRTSVPLTACSSI
jgi:hypothetical protein